MSLAMFLLCGLGVDIPESPVNKTKYHDKFNDDTGIQLRIIYGTEYGASEHHAKMLYKR